MKLFAVFMLAACLQVSAKGYGQNKVTLQLKSANLKEALQQLEKKAGIRFLYNDALIGNDQKVNLNANNEALEQVLNELFAGTAIQYKMMEDNLVVLSAGTDDKDNPVQVIRGKVTGTNGNPIAGATVLVRGTKNGTSTNATGNFAISADDAATLIFSYVGYETKQEPINGRSVINIELQESSTSRTTEDVVVIGYGSANRRDLTGSIVKIAGKEVADKPNTNPVASLQGKVAGLSVVNSGTPGQAPDIRIRGTVSIGQVHPLYVVDGILQDNIDYINPNDIESIEVLKDPSSLAIFGVRGATGAILITTKKARSGQTIINFNTTNGYKNLVDKIKMANASQFNTLFNEENANNGVTTPDYSALTGNTDWIDAVTRTAAFSTSNLSIASSTEKNKFNVGLGYTLDQGLIKHEQLDRMLLSMSNEVKLTNNIKVGVNLNITHQNDPYTANGANNSILNQARQVMPQISNGTKNFRVANPYTGDSLTMPIYSGLATALQASGVINPVLQLENTYNKDPHVEDRAVGSIYAEINFLKNFTFRSSFYADVSTTDERIYAPLYYAYNPISNTPYLYNTSTSVTETNNSYKKYQQDELLTFKKSFGDHNLSILGGFTTYYSGVFSRTGTAKQRTIGGIPIPNDERFWYISTQYEDPTNTLATSNQTEAVTVSELARAMYNYKNKYYLNASIRNDASSKLLPANQNQVFWAVGGAWDVTKEDFMKNVHVIDYLKLKGSIGVLGNQSAIGSDNTTQLAYPAYPFVTAGSSANFGTNVYAAPVLSYEVNPNLKWETVSSQEIGFELNAFKNRLHFEANYFNKLTHDLIVFVPRTPLKPKLENSGSIRNWGEEFTASWNQNISKDFSINFGGNITFLQNEIKSLAPEFPLLPAYQGNNPYISRSTQNNGSAESRSAVGHPIGEFYGYVVDGLYQSQLDILKSTPAKINGNSPNPGDFKFHDVNGDGTVDESDRTFIGNPTPKFTYGGNINVNYKNFSLGVDIGGVYGNQIFRVWGSLEAPFQRANYPLFKQNRWHGAGTSNWEPIISQGERYNFNGSTYNLEDGSYVRIRNIQLSYSFVQSLLSKVNIKSARIFVNVQNPKTWKHNEGYSPEHGGDATYFGYDYGDGAIPMVTTAGLNITF